MIKEVISLRLLVFILFLLNYTDVCSSENVKKSVYENRDDNGDSNDDGKDESMDVPYEADQNNATCTRRHNSQMHEVRSAFAKQFPFMAAIMSQQNEYLCSGAIVSNGLVLTSAQCIQKPINYILLNTTTAKRDNTSVLLHIIKSEKYPTYSGAGAGKDVGLVYTEKHNTSFVSKLGLSNMTTGDQLTDVEAFGFGLNTDSGLEKELQFVGLERRSPSNEHYFSAYLDCVETKVLTCFKDIGGPVIFDHQLVGVVVKGQSDCTREITSRYSINKFMIDFLPTYAFKAWLSERIKTNEEHEAVAMQTYPTKPILRQTAHVLTSTNRNSAQRWPLKVILLYLVSIVTYL
ncbi:PREDICTED: mast cell protease 3-like [Papilio xuthus]|uniref:Mast cell protease 3-like n=1 Tax=Papilio xuthus TaxID=66420 RepID=A0AAJ6Z734_PAPXU|nr:PREDICTED: mast cell protease 3-like [Papilio xuthus]